MEACRSYQSNYEIKKENTYYDPLSYYTNKVLLVQPLNRGLGWVKDVGKYMADNLAAIYRLMGDTAPVHLDPAVSSGFGYEKPFMQGLATYGFAVRMGVKAVGLENTARITRMNVQMRAVTYPGQKVTFQGWNIGPGAVGFKLKDEAGKALLDNGVIEYNAG